MKRTQVFILILILSSLACTFSSAQLSATNSKMPAPATQKPANATNTPQDTIYHARVTATDFLNIRQGPSADYPTIGYAMHGETVTVYNCVGDWAQIGAGRWVNSFYLDKRCP